MNLNHTVKVVGSVLLSAVMAGSMMPVTVFAQSNDENPTEKLDNRNQVKIKKISMIFHGFYCTLKIPEEKALFFRVF